MGVVRQLSKMHLQIVTVGTVLAFAGAQNFIAPPDRLWFRQDALADGQTCTSQYETVKDTDKVITGKGPIILPEEATFKVCIKFLAGVYLDPQTGENIERAGRDWHHDSGEKSPCAEGCCEYHYLEETTHTISGSKLSQTALTLPELPRLLSTSQLRLERPPQCALCCLERLERLESGQRSPGLLEPVSANAAPSSLPSY